MHVIRVNSNMTVSFNGVEYPCAVGRGGFSDTKQERDGTTPRGQFPLRAVYYRSDTMTRPETGLPVFAIGEHYGWCDDPSLPEYNTFVTLPFAGSHERLWRDDDRYDIAVVIGHNDAPVVTGKGSAIFMHIARPDYAPTDGCIALAKQDLLEILRHCTPDTIIHMEV